LASANDKARRYPAGMLTLPSLTTPLSTLPVLKSLIYKQVRSAYSDTVKSRLMVGLQAC